jgi:hypothetical protein
MRSLVLIFELNRSFLTSRLCARFSCATLSDYHGLPELQTEKQKSLKKVFQARFFAACTILRCENQRRRPMSTPPSELAVQTPPPQKGWRAIVRIASGIGLLIVGIVGLILPVMPGWVFIIPGLMILSDYFPPVKRLLSWAKSKYEAVKDKAS